MGSWLEEARDLLGDLTPLRVLSSRGSSVARACRWHHGGAARTIFVKHDERAPDDLFALEARGLDWLRGSALVIPEVLGVGRRFLALTWLEPCAPSPRAEQALGAGLAELHRRGAPTFGWDRDNYLASLVQHNAPARTWPTLWVEQRVAPLVEQAIGCGAGAARWRAAVDTLRDRASALWPQEPPARLHGDLWSGNVVFTDLGPALVDPAVYGGHREMDLAMLALFGGLSDHTSAAYREAYPLQPQWRERIPLAQLVPLLVHAVLFGGGYIGQVDSILRPFVPR
jgi:fructosamine-3-kinase